jgi:hypothetical protein
MWLWRVPKLYQQKAMCNMALPTFRLDGYTMVHKALKKQGLNTSVSITAAFG